MLMSVSYYSPPGHYFLQICATSEGVGKLYYDNLKASRLHNRPTRPGRTNLAYYVVSKCDCER